MRRKGDRKGIVFLLLIGVIFAAMVTVIVLSFKQDTVKENLQQDPVIKVLFVIEDKNQALFTDILIYYPVSGKGVLVNILKFFLSYILPAVAVGVFVMVFQPVDTVLQPRFIVLFSFVAAAIIFFALRTAELLSTSTKLYTADYERALEKDLASIDYSTGEMDAVTAKMYDNFRRNVEASSMCVYILNNQGELDTAYSSNNTDIKISLNNSMFDTLLNINKSVVVWSEIEKEHAVASIQSELTDFFEMSKSDALFILNEGHNIFGLITLGRKISGDHYKEYDYNVFVKLYSYFFVFGYYMRNISNKEIIGVVNREIKMSSQIITSIQENIDHLKTNKVDTGYLMVPAHNIGGEFIDMIRLTDNRHLFVVGDLSGKGIAASMNMVILKSIIRTYLNETHDFKQLVVKINSFIRDSLRKGTIFAGLFALIDFETDTMYYINCGIPALMMYTLAYNNVIEIQGSGHILGFVKDISPFISVKSTKLNRGDIIFACTDGMIQSHSLRGEQFGKERVQQALLDNSTYPAQRMAQFTFDGLLKFMSKEMEDDVSLLVLKYETSLEFNEEPVAEPEIEGTIDVPTDVSAPDIDEANEAPEEQVVVDEAVVEETVVEESAPVQETPAVDENFSIDDVLADDNTVIPDFDVPAEETSSDEPVVEETVAEDSFVEPESPVAESAPAEEPPMEEMPDLSDLDEMLKEAGL